MKRPLNFHILSLASAFTVALTGCAGTSSDVPPAAQHDVQPPPSRATVGAVSAASGLYVADFFGSIYEFAIPKLKLNTQFASTECTKGIKIDRHQSLYMPDNCGERILVYPKGSTRPSFVYSNNGIYDPADVAVARNGEVYVSNACCVGSPTNPTEVLMFHRGVSVPFEALPVQNGVPQGLALDEGGNLYVSVQYGQSGDVYKSIAGTGTLEALGLKGLQYPVGIAFDADGDIVVFDETTSQINIYQPGKKKPLRTITGIGTGTIGQGGYIAFNSSGSTLYVSTDNSSSRVVEAIDYASGKVTKVIGDGADWTPTGVAIGGIRKNQSPSVQRTRGL
jgi:DNA-binding beta-propeller fold protein YncE